MVELMLFVIATFVAFILFDRFLQENVEQVQSRNYVEQVSEPQFTHTSLFSVLGLSRDQIKSFTAFRDHFKSYEEISAAMKQAGVYGIRLIVGIDFSASNEWQGRVTFKGDCLHSLKGSSLYNPYQKVLSTLGRTLEPITHKTPIYAFGFGDVRTKNKDVFPLRSTGTPCADFSDLLDAYNHNAEKVQLSGPTSYSPIIHKAIQLVKEHPAYHLLIIVTDGQLKQEDKDSKQALVQASRNSLSVVAVGVGDGPWHSLEEMDDRLTDRYFDNFQFVNYHQVTRSSRHPEAALALHALMEIPDQYKAIVKLGYLGKC